MNLAWIWYDISSDLRVSDSDGRVVISSLDRWSGRAQGQPAQDENSDSHKETINS